VFSNLKAEVEGMDSNRLLNTASADLADYLTQKYAVESLTLKRDQWTASGSEIQIDVSQDPQRHIRDRSRSFNVPGQRIEVTVPFEGDGGLFFLRSSQFTLNPPSAQVTNGSLRFFYDLPNGVERDVKAETESQLAAIETHLRWQEENIRVFNGGLREKALQVVELRKKRLLENQGRMASLGIPVIGRAGAPLTYAIPVTKKKIALAAPPSSSSAFEPEPTWATDQYEQALQIMQNMTAVMERSPSAFSKMDEETLRQHFLVQLNGQFEGGATGETFNLGGKTDILLRASGRNVFIAECKFWKGPKQFLKAIDQLLGYTAWRDSKTAILIFNRGRDMSAVLKACDATMRAHPNFKRALPWNQASGLRYVLFQPGDPNREFIVSVMVFAIPDGGETPETT
jgi:hypothetical protein